MMTTGLSRLTSPSRCSPASPLAVSRALCTRPRLRSSGLPSCQSRPRSCRQAPSFRSAAPTTSQRGTPKRSPLRGPLTSGRRRPQRSGSRPHGNSAAWLASHWLGVAQNGSSGIQAGIWLVPVLGSAARTAVQGGAWGNMLLLWRLLIWCCSGGGSGGNSLNSKC